jgi:hypothetical protein
MGAGVRGWGLANPLRPRPAGADPGWGGLRRAPGARSRRRPGRHGRGRTRSLRGFAPLGLREHRLLRAAPGNRSRRRRLPRPAFRAGTREERLGPLERHGSSRGGLPSGLGAPCQVGQPPRRAADPHPGPRRERVGGTSERPGEAGSLRRRRGPPSDGSVARLRGREIRPAIHVVRRPGFHAPLPRWSRPAPRRAEQGARHLLPAPRARGRWPGSSSPRARPARRDRRNGRAFPRPPPRDGLLVGLGRHRRLGPAVPRAGRAAPRGCGGRGRGAVAVAGGARGVRRCRRPRQLSRRSRPGHRPCRPGS